MTLASSYAAAEKFYQAQQWPRAMAVYREIIAAAPAETRAWALLGLCATQHGDLVAATEALQRAADLEPTAANIHFRLGIALYYRGLATEAEAAFRRTVALNPNNIDALQNLAAVLVDQGRFLEAKPYFEMVLARDQNFELAWAGLANVHRTTGDTADMIKCLERAIALNPSNTATRHLLLAARGETPKHPDWGYVESFFDDYAARFEAHLVTRLDYDAPAVLTGLLRDHFPEPARFPRILDLGCGTGLLGAALREVYAGDALVGGVLIGVDLAGRMVQAAAARGIYTSVEKAEAEDYLQRTTQAFDLIAATDVFIYVGDVAELFALAAQRLSPGGVLAFTVEPVDGAGFVLQATGRYGHSAEYLRALAAKAQFQIIAEKTAPLRRHGQSLEEGLYMVLQRAP